MTTDLREELSALADTQSFSPDPSSWDRGRRVRRRDRVVRGAAVVGLVAAVVGLGSLAVRPSVVDPADAPRDGAIPSRIEDPVDSPRAETDLAIGRASVAFLSRTSGLPVVIGADDGRYHHLDLPDAPEDGGPLALSPDGRHLAWANHSRIHAVDLGSGSTSYFPSSSRSIAEVTDLHWSTDSSHLTWNAIGDRGEPTAGVQPVNGPPGRRVPQSFLRGIASPSGDLVALSSQETVDAAPFLRPRSGAAGGSRAETLGRRLPGDIYPTGASVTPLGWAAEDLLVARVHSTSGSYVEGHHVALFTSPDRPESEWTYRIVTTDIPQDAVDLSLAVDLLPDLDGTSSQELTVDFSESSGGDRWADLAEILAGVMAVLVGLVLIATMGRRA